MSLSRRKDSFSLKDGPKVFLEKIDNPNSDARLTDKRKQIEALWTIVKCFADAKYKVLGPDDLKDQETSGQVVDLTAVMQAAVVGLEVSEIQTETSKEEV